MLYLLLKVRPEHPLIYMIKFLANKVNDEDLLANGVVVKGDLPKFVPLLEYPQFTHES